MNSSVLFINPLHQSNQQNQQWGGICRRKQSKRKKKNQSIFVASRPVFRSTTKVWRIAKSSIRENAIRGGLVVVKIRSDARSCRGDCLHCRNGNWSDKLSSSQEWCNIKWKYWRHSSFAGEAHGSSLAVWQGKASSTLNCIQRICWCQIAFDACCRLVVRSTT